MRVRTCVRACVRKGLQKPVQPVHPASLPPYFFEKSGMQGSNRVPVLQNRGSKVEHEPPRHELSKAEPIWEKSLLRACTGFRSQKWNTRFPPLLELAVTVPRAPRGRTRSPAVDVGRDRVGRAAPLGLLHRRRPRRSEAERRLLHWEAFRWRQRPRRGAGRWIRGRNIGKRDQQFGSRRLLLASPTGALRHPAEADRAPHWGSPLPLPT